MWPFAFLHGVVLASSSGRLIIINTIRALVSDYGAIEIPNLPEISRYGG